ncbi:MAG: helix-turn-helix domain-containing protein [Sulfurimonadaceae bacterium]
MTTEEYENEIEKTIKDIATLGYKKMALTPEDVAVILGVDISTLYNWRRSGIGPQYRKTGTGKRNKIIYTPRSIAAFLLDQLQTA